MQIHCETADMVAVFRFLAGAMATEVGSNDSVLRREDGDISLPDCRGACEAVDLNCSQRLVSADHLRQTLKPKAMGRR